MVPYESTREQLLETTFQTAWRSCQDYQLPLRTGVWDDFAPVGLIELEWKVRKSGEYSRKLFPRDVSRLHSDKFPARLQLGGRAPFGYVRARRQPDPRVEIHSRLHKRDWRRLARGRRYP